MHAQVLLSISQHIKFELSSCTHSKDMIGGPKIENGSPIWRGGAAVGRWHLRLTGRGFDSEPVRFHVT